MKVSQSHRGFALVDLVVTCSLVVIIAGIAIPTMHATRERDASRMAGQHLAGRMQLARWEALKRNTHVALRFDPKTSGSCAPTSMATATVSCNAI